MYPSGALYILSKDLVSSIVEVAKISALFVELEGVEDHDIGTMLFISARKK